MPSATAFFARDGDGLKRTVSFSITLNKAATITWRIVNSAGDTVRNVRSSTATAAGTLTFAWDGRAEDGSWAPDGHYRSVVTAETDLGSYTHERSVFAGPFRTTPSVSAVARGGKVTLTIRSTETLSGAPKVTISQPGVASFVVSTTRVATRKYRVTVTLKPGGDAGTVTFLVRGKDKNGGTQESELRLPLS
jgi:flagellar hook assembly protein FlgD